MGGDNEVLKGMPSLVEATYDDIPENGTPSPQLADALPFPGVDGRTDVYPQRLERGL